MLFPCIGNIFWCENGIFLRMFWLLSEELLMSESVTRNNDTNITDISSKSGLSEESKMNGSASPSKGLHMPTPKVRHHMIICHFVILFHHFILFIPLLYFLFLGMVNISIILLQREALVSFHQVYLARVDNNFRYLKKKSGVWLKIRNLISSSWYIL